MTEMKEAIEWLQQVMEVVNVFVNMIEDKDASGLRRLISGLMFAFAVETVKAGDINEGTELLEEERRIRMTATDEEVIAYAECCIEAMINGTVTGLYKSLNKVEA